MRRACLQLMVCSVLAAGCVPDDPTGGLAAAGGRGFFRPSFERMNAEITACGVTARLDPAPGQFILLPLACVFTGETPLSHPAATPVGEEPGRARGRRGGPEITVGEIDIEVRGGLLNRVRKQRVPVRIPADEYPEMIDSFLDGIWNGPVAPGSPREASGPRVLAWTGRTPPSLRARHRREARLYGGDAETVADIDFIAVTRNLPPREGKSCGLYMGGGATGTLKLEYVDWEVSVRDRVTGAELAKQVFRVEDGRCPSETSGRLGSHNAKTSRAYPEEADVEPWLRSLVAPSEQDEDS